MKKVILAVALATLAQASICDIHMNLAYESFMKLQHFNGKDRARACYELKIMNEHLLNAKITCYYGQKEIQSMLEDTESMHSKNCRGKK